MDSGIAILLCCRLFDENFLRAELMDWTFYFGKNIWKT